VTRACGPHVDSTTARSQAMTVIKVACGQAAVLSMPREARSPAGSVRNFVCKTVMRVGAVGNRVLRLTRGLTN